MNVFARLANTADTNDPSGDVERLFTRAMCLDPSDPLVLSNYGKLRARAGDRDTLVVFNLRALLVAPGFERAERRLAAALGSVLLKALDRRDWRGLEHLPIHDNSMLLLWVAQRHLEAKDRDRAHSSAKRAAVLSPRTAEAWVMLALAETDPEEFAYGRSTWRRARLCSASKAQTPDYWEAMNALGGSRGKSIVPMIAHLAGHAQDRDARTSLIETFVSRSTAGPPGRKADLEITQKPMLLISQIQRSGGSLLLQLLDGHPELFVYPYELILGVPWKANWVDLDLDAGPADWLAQLFDIRIPRFLVEGYSKSDRNQFAKGHCLNFEFGLAKFFDCFMFLATQRKPESQREILNWYFTAYFEAWRDRLRTGREHFVAAFRPRLAMHPLGLARFRCDYPDGWLVGCIRHPRDWLLSAQLHDPRYQHAETALNLWRISGEALLHQSLENARTHVFTYENIVKQPRIELSRFTAAIGIKYTKSLLVPTFASKASPPNSSFDIVGSGISQESLSRPDPLPNDVEMIIQDQFEPLYEQACALLESRDEQ